MCSSVLKLKSPKPLIVTPWTIHGPINNAVFYHHESSVEEIEAQRRIASKTGLGTQVAEPESPSISLHLKGFKTTQLSNCTWPVLHITQIFALRLAPQSSTTTWQSFPCSSCRAEMSVSCCVLPGAACRVGCLCLGEGGIPSRDLQTG